MFRLLLLLASLLIPTGLNAAAVEAKAPHATLRLATAVDHFEPGKPFLASLQFRIAPEWHIYWENPGDSGIPATLAWSLPKGWQAGAIQWPVPRRIPVDTLVNYGYEGRPQLLIPLTPAEDTTGVAPLKVKVEYLICKDVCIPESAELALDLAAGQADESAEAASVSVTQAALPQPVAGARFTLSGAAEARTISLQVPVADNGWQDAYFYARDPSTVRHDAPQKARFSQGELTLTIPAGSEPSATTLSGILVVEKPGASEAYDVMISPQAASSEGLGFLAQALLFAFLGGMLLNAMPCVFPVLCLKALAVARKAAESPAQARLQGLAYTGGIVASFLALGGAMLLLQQSGQAVGWGFQLQSPPFVGAMIYLFVLLGFSLGGYFHLPVMGGDFGPSHATHDTLRGSFFTGVLAVVVATPCSVPFMAPAIGYAFAQPPLATLAVMVALGLGLAAPYLLISLFPALRRWLPRPGVWMERFKQFMAFPLVATALWLLWVLSQLASPEAALRISLGSLLVLLLIWLARPRAGVGKAILFVIGAALVGWSLHSLPRSAGAAPVEQGVEAFAPAKLESLRAAGTPVLVDATADWCITCKVNERVALGDSAVQAAMKAKSIKLLRADWTRQDAKITAYLAQFNRRGVPLYVYYPPKGEPQVLPQILTPQTVLDAFNQGDAR